MRKAPVRYVSAGMESMKSISADEIIAASKENNELERITHIATEATYKAVIEKLENLRVYAVTVLDSKE